jgi:hypothetical protein
MKPLLFPAALVLLILGAIAAVVMLKHNAPEGPIRISEQQAAATRQSARYQTATSHDQPQVSPELIALAQRLRETQSNRARPSRPASAAAATTTTNESDEDDLDPILLARVALAYVGADPDAEAFWLGMINNPDVPAEERTDLIEDLNEQGFADPEHITAAELPLIEARIALIERIAPGAMDQTNADAFKEALKDLKEMQAKLKPETPATPPAPAQTDASPSPAK